jgi:DNA repair protein REV1
VDTFLCSLVAELSSRMIKESFVGSHLSLKVMKRAADAPLDPPKHLGHGLCDTLNRSVQLGVPTSDPEVLARETVSMMRSLRIPPAELRGIGLHMAKLEKVAAILDAGQRKLDFTKSVKIKLSESPKKEIAEIPRPSTPVKSTQYIAPTQIDPEVLANLPEEIRSRLVRPPELVTPRKRSMDEDVFNELPPSIQAELRPLKKPTLKLTPKKKRTSPRKVKILPGQAKLPLPTPEDLDVEFLAELPSTLRKEVIANSRREQALARVAKERSMALAAEKLVWDRKVNRTITISDPPPQPKFQKMSQLSDLRELISSWFEASRDEGPAEEDVELLGSYLKKVVLVEKDLRKAEGVVNWVLWCCGEYAATVEEWWDAGEHLAGCVNTACTERGVGKIKFDIRSSEY